MPQIHWISFELGAAAGLILAGIISAAITGARLARNQQAMRRIKHYQRITGKHAGPRS